MTYTLPILFSSIIFAIIFVLILPTSLTLGAEYILTKKITPLVALFIAGLSILLFVLIILQLTSSKIELKNDSLFMSSIFYSKSIQFTDISSVSQTYENGLPEDYVLNVRKSGVGLTNYWAGNFQLNNGLAAYVLMSSPPYTVVKTNSKEVYIISINKAFMTALSKKLPSY
jgi:hypothetical protein